jgi:hypothetical protein
MNRAERTCQKKTARGNVFANPIDAVKMAIEMNLRKDCRLHAYRCKVCGQLHVGSPINPKWLRRKATP